MTFRGHNFHYFVAQVAPLSSLSSMKSEKFQNRSEKTQVNLQRAKRLSLSAAHVFSRKQFVHEHIASTPFPEYAQV